MRSDASISAISARWRAMRRRADASTKQGRSAPPNGSPRHRRQRRLDSASTARPTRPAATCSSAAASRRSNWTTSIVAGSTRSVRPIDFTETTALLHRRGARPAWRSADGRARSTTAWRGPGRRRATALDDPVVRHRAPGSSASIDSSAGRLVPASDVVRPVPVISTVPRIAMRGLGQRARRARSISMPDSVTPAI